jgi:hypothetical protein
MALTKIVVLLALSSLTCAWLFEPIPLGEEWTPPPVYREIWKEAEACTGKRGNFDRVRWGLVAGKEFDCNGKGAIGCWTKPHQIAIANDWKNIQWVVKHEMIHDLMQLSHDGGERDIQIWGKQCHAMWGYLDNDPNYRP